jgi:hypothetical protein
MTNLRQFASIDGSKRMDGVIKDDAIKTGEQLEKCLCIHAEAALYWRIQRSVRVQLHITGEP